MKGPLEAMKTDLQGDGDTLNIEYGLSGELKERLLKGDTCGVMILTKTAVADLAKAGKLEADEVVDKFPQQGDATQAVARGESQYVFKQLSEILGEPGIEHVAQLPADLQTYTVFTAAKCSGAKDTKAAEKLIIGRIKPEAVKVYQSKGLEPI